MSRILDWIITLRFTTTTCPAGFIGCEIVFFRSKSIDQIIQGPASYKNSQTVL
ncbi:MAG: hypothetical protein HN443_00345 [Flavobacteriaceae bacterium]|nr:hypothetical protein [Flavobacteriaceae bacterium]